MTDIYCYSCYCAPKDSDELPMLAVHGWGDCGESWSSHLAGLSAIGRTLVPDLRGHGRSPASADGYGPRALAADLAELLARRRTGPVVAIGHSMGGQVVSALAIEHPDTVAAVIVIDPAYGADDAGRELAGEQLAALRTRGAAAAVEILGDDLPPAYQKRLLATPGHVLSACYAGMYTDEDAFGFRAASERYLRKRHQPVLALYSRPGPAAWERSLPLPPGSQVVTWDGGGHFLHIDRPGEFVSLVGRWLSASRPGTTGRNA